MNNFLAVFFGGAIGAMLRYGFCLLLGNKIVFKDIPVAIIIVNLLGCFVAGFLFDKINNEVLKLFIITGIMGGFTTFSAFGIEAIKLLQTNMLAFIIYIAITVIFGLFMCFLGTKL